LNGPNLRRETASKQRGSEILTARWQQAQKEMRQWEADDRPTQKSLRKTLDSAWKNFIADLESRKLKESTVRKYKLLDRQMEEFGRARGLSFLDEMDAGLVSEFRATWKDGARSSAKKLERLRAFFRFAEILKWIPENPSCRLKARK
jgi:hypothetical protein